MSRYPRQLGGPAAQPRPLPSFPEGPLGLPANDNVPGPSNDNFPESHFGRRAQAFGGFRGGLFALEEQFSVGALLLDYANQVFVYELSTMHGNPWTVTCDVRGVCVNYHDGRWVPNGTNWGCSTLCTGGGLSGFGGPPLPNDPNATLAGFWEYQVAAPNIGQWRCRAMASRPAGPVVLPIQHGSTWPIEVPDAPLWLDPFSQPVRGPTPRPVAPPYKAIPDLQPNPWRSPTEQPQRGPEPRPRPRFRPRPRVRPDGEPAPLEFTPSPTVDPAPSPDGAPWIKPGHNAAHRPGPKGRPLGGGHVRRPPGKGEKERKGKAEGIMGAAVRAAFAASEANDAIGAIYNATGTRAQRKAWEAKHGHTPQAKAAFIYNNADAINLSDAAKNLIVNELGDRAAAKFFGTAGRAIQPIVGHQQIPGSGAGSFHWGS